MHFEVGHSAIGVETLNWFNNEQRLECMYVINAINVYENVECLTMCYNDYALSYILHVYVG